MSYPQAVSCISLIDVKPGDTIVIVTSGGTFYLTPTPERRMCNDEKMRGLFITCSDPEWGGLPGRPAAISASNHVCAGKVWQFGSPIKSFEGLLVYAIWRGDH